MQDGKRARQKAETRAAILAAAQNVYAQQGFFAPTGDIAQAAGVAHGSVFAHFGTTEALQEAAVEAFAHTVAEALSALDRAGGDFAALLRAHLEVLQAHEAFYTRLITQRTQLPQAVASAVVAIQSTLSIHFAPAIQRGIDAGTLKDIPPHMVFNGWLALVHYYLQNGDLFSPGAPVLPRYKPLLCETYLQLVHR